MREIPQSADTSSGGAAFGFCPAGTEGPRPASPYVRYMTRRFDFADAWWFRVPLRFVVLAVTVFTLISLEPALLDRASPDHLRALFGIGMLAFFMLGAVVFMVSLDDSYVQIEEGVVTVRFESFFHVDFLASDVISVAPVDPHPRWRYRWGLATNFHDRVSCSHGGQLVEVQLEHPCVVRLWPRTLHVTRFWLAARDYRALMAALEPGSFRSLDALPAAA